MGTLLKNYMGKSPRFSHEIVIIQVSKLQICMYFSRKCLLWHINSKLVGPETVFFFLFSAVSMDEQNRASLLERIDADVMETHDSVVHEKTRQNYHCAYRQWYLVSLRKDFFHPEKRNICYFLRRLFEGLCGHFFSWISSSF